VLLVVAQEVSIIGFLKFLVVVEEEAHGEQCDH
jgi:hypothetical protein